ncbi:hypothetical protein [Burkholderia sp. LMG 13014]|uniref:hypothetical protein n=1 Tax=Burkholderia sp. LMG 13014 TaxID=2709306 RepID=UPI0019638B8C|nr:hypothetical protein [Burkholderia sp. LMG 13014]
MSAVKCSERYGRRGLAIALLMVNLGIMLLPPVYLTMVCGNLALGFVYIGGAAMVLIASMLFLYSLEKRSGRST